MALIGRVETDSQPGQGALQAVPDMILRLEDIRSDHDSEWRVIFWASGDDFEAYEAALADDPDVAGYELLTELPDRRLYGVTLAGNTNPRALHPIVVEQDITILDLTMTAERLRLLARFPSREALAALRDACRERDMEFHLEQLYDEESVANDGGVESRYGVTEPQREALLRALEAGYFDVPRETKMAAIADEMGVSTTALSRRLRRGQRNLLRNTLALQTTT
ncbi:helix-turn-helix domain-containing protein [Halorussus sp. MSC15.2]|uniref:helix-turn-helix domain-containing protein n=1 Tax=Halorussus sp. MSC15.2 TaxID=2283638 RepID=UPI0013D42986|nr:helix-turn-helix domain-containing protein [Halorussus sp. MSC15.2]NEU55812.1 bacterio-opsin activator [Halorussus sp. MSC15.2]